MTDDVVNQVFQTAVICFWSLAVFCNRVWYKHAAA